MYKYFIALSCAIMLSAPLSAHALTGTQIEAVLQLLRAFNTSEEMVQNLARALEPTREILNPNTSVTPETTTPATPSPTPPVSPTPTSPIQNPISPTFSTVLLSASPVSVQAGNQVTLSWNGEGVSSCSFTKGDSKPTGTYAPNSSVTVTPSQTTRYTITCTGSSNSASDSISITVSPKEEVVEEEPAPPQTTIIDAHNVYSPEVVVDGSNTWLYFGGWLKNGQTHDNIYRAHCDADLTSCKNIELIIDAEKYGFTHFNDPDIVRMPGDYYIMYMTGLPEGEGNVAASDHNIYYATSWVGDGFNWSKPALLVEDYWLPSGVVLPNGNVYLYANDTLIHGGVVRMNMGPSGIGLQETTRISYGNAAPKNANYANIDVSYDSIVGSYKIFAERAIPQSVVDVFSSLNGVDWYITAAEAVTPAEGQYRVNTPTRNPHSKHQVLFGSTSQQNSMGFKIRKASFLHKDDISQPF